MSQIGREMKFIEQMKEFCNGKWQKEIPQKEGSFVTANYRGEIIRTLAVVYKDPHNGVYYFAPPVWGSWVWSEPIPDNFGLPNPPGEKE